VIHIKRGVYKEFIVLGQEKCNVVLIGDGKAATVISGSRCCADGFNTPDTAVLSGYSSFPSKLIIYACIIVLCKEILSLINVHYKTA
jgi:pectin methylesterase-like acyl-CoA thioesterase